MRSKSDKWGKQDTRPCQSYTRLKGSGVLEHWICHARRGKLHGTEHGCRNAHDSRAGQPDDDVEYTAGEGLLVRRETAHDIHVGHIKVEIGTGNVENEGGENKGKVVAVLTHERQEQAGGQEAERAANHDESIVDLVQYVPGNDVPDEARDGHGQQVDGDDDGRQLLDALHVVGDPEPGRGKGHHAQQDGDDDEGEVAVPPDVRGHERCRVGALPQDEDGEQDDADDEQGDDVRAGPAVVGAQGEARREHASAKDGEDGADVVKGAQCPEALAQRGAVDKVLDVGHGPDGVGGEEGPEDAEEDVGGAPGRDGRRDAADDHAKDEAQRVAGAKGGEGEVLSL